MTVSDPFGPPSSPAPSGLSPAEPAAKPDVPAPAAEPVAAVARREALSTVDGAFAPPEPFPDWPDVDGPNLAYEPQDVSFEDLREINMEILRLRRLQRELADRLAQCGREVTRAALAYDRAYNRALLSQKGGSAEGRKAAAELACEALDAQHEISKRVYDTVQTRFRLVRDDQDTLKNLSSNIRAAMALR